MHFKGNIPLALILLLVLATCAVAVYAATGGTLEDAQAEFDKHNYKKASAILDGVIKSAEAGGDQKTLLKAIRLQVFSKSAGNFGNPAADLAELIKKHPSLAADIARAPDLHRALAKWHGKRWNLAAAYKEYVKAADLFGACSLPTGAQSAAECWISAARIIIRREYVLPRPASITQKQWGQWSVRREYAKGEIILILTKVANSPSGVSARTRAEALRVAGEYLAGLGQWDDAEEGIELMRRCVKKFSQTSYAPESQFLIAATLEQFGRYPQAIKDYAKMCQMYPKHGKCKLSRKRIIEIKKPGIKLGVTGSFAPGSNPVMSWHIRNVKTLHLTARRVDLCKGLSAIWAPRMMLQALKKQAIENETIVAKWKFQTPDEGKHNVHWYVPDAENSTTVAIKAPFSLPGAYVVSAIGTNADGNETVADCLLIVSTIEAVAKNDHDDTIVFVTDSATGKPITGANVMVAVSSNARVFKHVNTTTNDAGIAIVKTASQPRESWIVTARKADQQAIVAKGSRNSYWWGYRGDSVVYGFTERPVYRPGHTVHFKQIVRGSKEGVYTNIPNRKLKVTITDPRRQSVYSRELITDQYGAVEGDFTIGKDAPLGIYSIKVQSSLTRWQMQSGGRFRVEEYRKPEYKVSVSAARPDYRIGEEMKIRVTAKYYHGQPVANAEVKYDIRKRSYRHSTTWHRRWSWYYESLGRHRRWYGRRLNEHVTRGEVKTDENGDAFITLKAEPFKNHETEDIVFSVSATVSDASRRQIRASGQVKVTHAPFFIYPKPAESVYAPGDNVRIDIRTESPNAKPVAGHFVLEAWTVVRKQVTEKVDGKDVTRTVDTLDVRVFSKQLAIGETGRGSVRFTPDVEGHFRIIVKNLSDACKGIRKVGDVEGKCDVWVAPRTGVLKNYALTDLQLIPAKDQYEIGKTMKVLINTRQPDSYVLLTAEADEILLHKVIHISGNSKLVELPVGKNMCPNFTLTATLIRDRKMHTESKKIIVPPTHRFLNVAVTLDKGSLGGNTEGGTPKFQPREKTKVHVTVTDVFTGKPVVGQVTLMMVDSSVYYIQPEFRQKINKAFYGHVRSVQVGTSDSFRGAQALNPVNWRNRRRSGAYRGMSLGSHVYYSGRGSNKSMIEAAPMAAKQESSEDRDEGLATPVVRSEFRDTVLWAGSVQTDANGKAEVPVTMPDQLTTFALHAIAYDKDTRVGESTTDVITTKRIIARIQSGRFFTEGDHSYVTVIAHNYYDKASDVTVDFTASDNLKLRKVRMDGVWHDYVSGQELKMTISAGGEARLDFQTTAVRAGDVKLLARVRSVAESDAIELTKPIVPWGAVKLLAGGGIIDAKPDATSGQWSVGIPEKIGKGSQSLTITLNPSVAAVAMEALPYLSAYPYGCVEQTMSRFLPTVVMRKTLRDAGVSLDDIRKLVETRKSQDPKLAARHKMIAQRMGRNAVYSEAEVSKMIAAGVKRLADMQHSDGGWGWWKKSESDPYMTAYVVSGLVLLKDADSKHARQASQMYTKAAKWLAVRASRPRDEAKRHWWYRHTDNDNTRAYMLYAIGQADASLLKKSKCMAELGRLYKGRDDLTDYGRALLAIALHSAGRVADAKIVVENFSNTVTIDKKTGDAHWGRTGGWWYWYHGGTETTSWVLQAILTVDGAKGQYAAESVRWLVNNRRDFYWRNTKSTAMAIYALARYAKVSGELDCDMTATVTVDGSISRTIRITRENMFAFDSQITLAASALPPGAHNVEVSCKGTGRLYWAAYVKYYDKSERIKAGGNRVGVTRTYYRLVPEVFTNSRTIWKSGKRMVEKFQDTRFKEERLAFGAEIASGDLVKVVMDIDATDNLEYVVFEDPKPAGCEPYKLTSGYTWGSGFGSAMELRDTKVAFFASWVPRGKRQISYRLVCEQPGTFRVLPSSAEAMYTPWVQAISDSGKLTITGSDN